MTDRSKEVAAAAAETAIVSGSSAATAASFQVLAAKFVPYAMSACGTIIPGIGTIHVPGGVSRIPAILFDGNCRHASSHRRRWCLSSIHKQENDWISHY